MILFSDKLKKVYPYVITITIFLLIIYFLDSEFNEISKARNLNLATAITVSIMFIIFQFFNGFLLASLLSFSNCSLSLYDSFKLVCLRTYYNYLPLNAGLFLTGVYLKKEKNFPVSRFVGLQAFTLIIKLSTYGVVGLMFSIILYYRNIYIPMEIFFSMILLSITPIGKIKSDNKIARFYNSAMLGFRELSGHYKAIFLISFLSLILLVLMSLRLWFIAKDLDINLSLEIILYITVFNNILRVTTILPGNLGIRQTVAGTIAVIFSLDFIDGFLPSLIDHLLAMLITLFLGIIFSIKMSKEFFSNDKPLS